MLLICINIYDAVTIEVSMLATMISSVHRATYRNIQIWKFTYKHALSEPAEHVEAEVEVELAINDATASISKI